MAVLAAHSIVQATLVKVLLGDVQAAVIGRTFDQCVLAIQHNMVMYIGSLFNPIATRLCVWALDNELVEHRLYNLGNRHWLLRGVDPPPARWARLLGVLLGVPGMVQTLTAEVMLAGKLDGLVEGRVADEADQVAVARGHVLEQVDVGWELCDAALSTLRRW